MNTIDKYYFFLQKAITNVEFDKKYYFEKENDLLYCTIKTETGLSQYFRNENVQVDKSKRILVKGLIENEINTVEIPKILFLDKKKFLVDFVDNEEDLELKEKLKQELELFNESSDFLNCFIEIIQSVDKRKAYDFHMALGSFLSVKIKEITESMGLTENSDVVW
ncbi:hypothetical protein [Flavobacterium sp.]|uniref:hypothetical protein n=1 Tax=Flavobacterium sp. TaxID=239 RepID=UPI002623B23C|nr:hypothetical protein [Flavobacterium sp.]